jgi:glycosyltransferase involved in cell wall biosynthesis
MSVAGESLELTILMPCLNEAETIASCVRKARGYLDSRGLAGEVLVADHGSMDGSQVLAQACGARVIQIDGFGYGTALLGGIQAARGRYVVMGDADGSHDFSALEPFMEKLRAGYELVLGNRFLGGLSPRAMPPLHRYLGHPVLSGIGRLLFLSTNGDLQCGLRGLRRDSILSLGLTSPGMELAAEMVAKAKLRKLRVAEVPATVTPDGHVRSPHRGSWRDGWQGLRFLLLFSPASLFFYPGCAVLLLSIAAMSWLLPGSHTVAGRTLGLEALVFAAAGIVCGFQAIVFYMFAKTYAIRSGLLPADRLVERLRSALRLEFAVGAGGICILVGVILATIAATSWSHAALGTLTAEQTVRLTILSVTLLVLGTQVVFSGGLVMMVDLDTRTNYARTRRTDPMRAQPPGEAVQGPDSIIH